MRFRNQRFQVMHMAVGAGVLQQQAEGLCAARELGGVTDHHLDIQRLGAGTHHGNGLWMAVFRDNQCAAAILLVDPLHKGHGLRRGGAFVQHGGIGQFHAGQVHDGLLEGEQGFKTTLGYLRLVGCIRGVPTRVFQHIALDDCGGIGVVVASADVGFEHTVLAGNGTQTRQHGLFGLRRGQVHGRLVADACGHGGVNQGVEAVEAEQARHLRLLRRRGPDMAPNEFLRVFQFGQRKTSHGSSGAGVAAGCQGRREW